MRRVAFPPGFLWGAATAAYQIEGSPLADGACPSIWHEFTHKRRKIKGGANGDVACDHYHRYREDIRSLRDLGLGAYRFSIAWPRICPERGRINPKGLDFYNRIVDCLLENGIEPFPTLFHWDAPSWLEREGGFAVRSSIERFLEYAAAVLHALGDRVKSWITLNEPSLFAFFGYGTGIFAPGRKMDLRSVYHISHHLMMAHARLVEAFPGLVRGGRIGLAHHFVWVTPRDPGNRRDADTAAFMDEGANRFYMDAMYRGNYPERVVSRMGRFFPKGFEKDLPGMKRPGDFFGMNYYTRNIYRYARFKPYTHAKDIREPGSRWSAMWEIYPEGLYKALLRLRDEYGNPPCIITENGYPLPESDGKDPLEDGERISYISEHLAEAGKAISEGVDCRGYFYWSLMDNLEWAEGFTMRFGLLRTDFKTLERIPRASASWYRRVATSNALDVESVPS
jgi:beta-glucosidase